VKILHVLGSNKYSGAENIAISIISGLSSEFEMAYCSPDGEIRSFLEREGIQFSPLNGRSLFDLCRVFKQYKPDIVHAHDYWACTMSAMSPLTFRLILHLHNNSPDAKYVNFKTTSFLLPLLRSRSIIGVSQMVFDEHIYRCVLKRKGEIIPNSIDIKKIKSLAEEHAKSKNYSLFFLGRLCEQKDPFFFIDLAANLSRVTPGFSAALIGDGPLYSSCRAKIEELNMRNNIEMYGFLKNPYSLLKNASILVMPSRWEGFGLVALEAMCLGVPVLARPVGGLKSIISESGGGFLCDTLEQFIERASKILRDSEFRQKIGEQGQSWVSENLAYTTYLDKFRKIYTLNGRGKR